MTSAPADTATVLDELRRRGLVALSTDEAALREALGGGALTFYVGFDPTAPSLHIGNLVQLLTARRLQRAGHRPLALVGGATGLVGDPSGKSSERVLNPADVVDEWVRRLRRQIEPFFDFSGPAAATMVNNLDWTAAMSAVDFLRDVGKHFPVNRMLDRESVSTRLAAGGLSYTEFSYQVLQANDYLELHRRYGCVLQTGGSDQWGNITAGVELVRRVTGDRVHALATPLVTRADGTKFGKTESGTVWLDPSMTSPYAFYQFWLGTDDRDVVPYLRIFSDLDQDAVAELERLTAERPGERQAQRALATGLTTVVHGAQECRQAAEASAALFGQGDLADVDERTLAAALAESGLVRLGPGEDASWVDLLSRTGLVASRSAARRAVAEGGAYVNNRRLERDIDPDAGPEASDFLHGRWLVLRRGRRSVAGVERTR